ncbi:MAG: HEAT repeat domain-containing protein, partial [Burkholderiales bacterium]
IAVLYALDSVKALDDADLIKALGDEHPQVRRQAIRLSESRLDKSAAIREKVVSLVVDADPVVQFQLALSLGECHHEEATRAIAAIVLQSSKNRDIADAALTSIVERAGDVLALVLKNDKWAASTSGESIIGAMVGQIARQRRVEDLDTLIARLQTGDGKQRAGSQAVLLKALSRLPADALAGSSPPQLVKLRELQQSAAKGLIAKAERVLNDPQANVDDRVAAIEELALDKFDRQRELLEKLLAPREPEAIHEAVLATCGQFDSPEVAKLVLVHWSQFSPSEQALATDLLLRRGTWALAFVEFLEKNNVKIATFDPAQVSKIANYPSAKVREIARKLSGQGVTADRQQVFADYREIALSKGDAEQGKAVFAKNCSACHEVAGVGNAVGPNLAAMINRGTESVLLNVLAPNMEVDPRFFEYVVLTGDGQVITGVVAGETSTAVTIRGAENKTTTVLRVDIEDIHSTGKSLMPEGLEKAIDKKSMANLLTFLQQAAGAQGAVK